MSALEDFYRNPDLKDGFGSTLGGRPNPHRGLDFAQGLGKPIPALGAGVVVNSEWSASLGNIVQVRQDDGRFVGYRHMRSSAPRVAFGVRINKGDIVGQVSDTGSAAQGYHLCTTNSSNARGVFGEEGVTDPWPWIEFYLYGGPSPIVPAEVPWRDEPGFVRVPGDGPLVWPKGDLMKRIQTGLAKRKRYDGKKDGDGGDLTARGIQITLNESGRFGGIAVPNYSLKSEIDGKLGGGAAWGVQEYAKDFGKYKGVQDGDPRTASWTAFAIGLETD